MILFLSLFLISFVSADKVVQISDTGLIIEYQKFEYFEIGKPFEVQVNVFNQSGLKLANDTTTCYFMATHKNGTTAVRGEMNYTDGLFNFLIPGEAFIGGKSSWSVNCNTSTEGGFVSGPAIISLSGFEEPTGFDGRVILLSFFIGLIILLVYAQRNIDFDKWYNKITSKYKNGNFFRVFIASTGYYFMNNPFSLFYMIGLFVILILQDITIAYNLSAIYEVARVFVGIYLVGLVLIGLEVFGDIHQIFSKIMDDIKKNTWGINNEKKS